MVTHIPIFLLLHNKGICILVFLLLHLKRAPLSGTDSSLLAQPMQEMRRIQQERCITPVNFKLEMQEMRRIQQERCMWTTKLGIWVQ